MTPVHSFEQTPPEARGLLKVQIKDLGLKLEGSMLEKYIAQLYRELAAKGLSRFHPPCYLSDEWACPDREPIIGIPFYLADPKLAAPLSGVGGAGQAGVRRPDGQGARGKGPAALGGQGGAARRRDAGDHRGLLPRAHTGRDARGGRLAARCGPRRSLRTCGATGLAVSS